MNITQVMIITKNSYLLRLGLHCKVCTATLLLKFYTLSKRADNAKVRLQNDLVSSKTPLHLSGVLDMNTGITFASLRYRVLREKII